VTPDCGRIRKKTRAANAPKKLPARVKQHFDWPEAVGCHPEHAPPHRWSFCGGLQAPAGSPRFRSSRRLQTCSANPKPASA
jgi:hypothetical protein